MTALRIPRHTRPRIYAANELFLDMLYAVRSRVHEIDLEALLILLVVNEASMRPLLLGAAPRDILTEPVPQPDERGAISRVLIADKTGLARDTVRRKVKQLIELGLLQERREGEVQSVPKLDDVAFQTIGDECFEAVERYHQRLAALGEDEDGRARKGEGR